MANAQKLAEKADEDAKFALERAERHKKEAEEAKVLKQGPVVLRPKSIVFCDRRN